MVSQWANPNKIYPNLLKEHVALDRSSWSLKSVWNRLLWNAYGWRDILILIHTSIIPNCTVFLLRRELTRLDSTKWSTVFLWAVKGTPCNFKACLFGSLYSTFKLSIYNHLHFITNGLKHFSKTNSTDPRQHIPLSSNLNATNVVPNVFFARWELTSIHKYLKTVSLFLLVESASRGCV